MPYRITQLFDSIMIGWHQSDALFDNFDISKSNKSSTFKFGAGYYFNIEKPKLDSKYLYKCRIDLEKVFSRFSSTFEAKQWKELQNRLLPDLPVTLYSEKNTDYENYYSICYVCTENGVEPKKILDETYKIFGVNGYMFREQDLIVCINPNAIRILKVIKNEN